MSKSEVTKWYLKKHSGPKLHKLWQLAIGSSVFIVFVLIPTTYDITTTQRKKIAERSGLGINPIQQKVYEKRVAWRNLT